MSEILICKRCKVQYDWSEGKGYDRDYCSCYCERTDKIDELKAERDEARKDTARLVSALRSGIAAACANSVPSKEWILDSNAAIDAAMEGGE